jgi:succinate dehydrogenase/fumarate reductase cytochrome b subunit
MQASSRVVYGRTFRVTPAWMWWVQRVSGLALGPLVALHMWVADLDKNAALNAVLLALVVGHGYSGIKRMVQSERVSSLVTANAWAWLGVVTVFGMLIVLFGR